MELNFGKLGFGFLRLPQAENGDVDPETTKEMVDLFLQRGFCYFDTAYTYLNGRSEEALRTALVERHPRSAYMVATKLPCSCLKSGKTPWEIFELQRKRIGVDYFDVYLLHGLDDEDARYAEEMGFFDFLQELKEKGLVRYTGFSFHDTAEVLDRILSRHPEVDLVQIQLNYLDWDNSIIQSGACHRVCRAHAKPILVMEPVKGGTLAAIPPEAERLLKGELPAHRAIRFAASQEGVALVLSGMSTLRQVEENTGFMTDFVPLTHEETSVLHDAARIIREAVAIDCTQCGYCLDHCPVGIPIPTYFRLFNDRSQDGWQARTEERYAALTQTHPRADACLSCGRCQSNCPQKLPIPMLLQEFSAVFDK